MCVCVITVCVCVCVRVCVLGVHADVCVSVSVSVSVCFCVCESMHLWGLGVSYLFCSLSHSGKWSANQHIRSDLKFSWTRHTSVWKDLELSNIRHFIVMYYLSSLCKSWALLLTAWNRHVYMLDQLSSTISLICTVFSYIYLEYLTSDSNI